MAKFLGAPLDIPAATAGTHAVRKQYVDNADAALAARLGVLEAGGSGGGQSLKVRATTQAITAAAGDFVLADAALGSLVITLPASPATNTSVAVKKVDNSLNLVVVAGAGSSLIDGDSTLDLIQAQSGAVLVYDGTNWRVEATVIFDPGARNFTFRGEWSNTVTYGVNDVVYYHRSAYLAKQGSTGVEPTVDGSNATWGLLVLHGAIGDPGPQGPKGDTGDTGPAGPKGDTGSAGPAGADGATGPAGVQGATGPAGPKGDTGAPGPIGATGAQGDPGPAGPAGAQGVQGPKGDQGEQGPPGAGSAGDVGPMGPKGDTGAQGAAGPQGVAGPAGATGPQGDPGVAGPAGPTGAAGPTGPKGDQGDVGPAGPTGATGPEGPTGLKGDKGETGTVGATGPAGPGIAAGGTAGQTLTKKSATDFDTQWGNPGVGLWNLVTVAWNEPDPTYTAKAGDYVLADAFDTPSAAGPMSITLPVATAGQMVKVRNIGSGRISINPGPDQFLLFGAPDALTKNTETVTYVAYSYPVTPELSFTVWVPAESGMNFKGEFDLDTTYVANDVVTYDGGSWVYFLSVGVAGQPPGEGSSFWKLLGRAGATGPAGPAGPKGDTGAAGAAGPTGPKGDTGAAGAAGPTGATGAAGAAGATGPAGPKGDTGATGPAGPAGDPGPAGAAGPKGDTGAAGPKGDTGAAGATGATGPKGDTGAAGAPGATGATGAAGLKGDTGVAGPAGATGAQGPAGATGAQGPAGPTGAAGPKGDTGSVGATGPTGPAGPKGDQGEANYASPTFTGVTTLSGGVRYNTLTQSTAYTILLTDRVVLTNNASSMVITLPSAVTAGNGAVFTVKNIGAGLVTMGSSAGTIDGVSASTVTIAQWVSRTFLSNGTNWFMM